MPISLAFVLLYVFMFFIAIQIFYYLFFFSRLAFYLNPENKTHQTKVPISVIVCAFNEEANLKKNLMKLLEQDYHKDGKPLFEVLVVNDNSEDETFYFLNQMKETHAHLHIVHLTQDAKMIPGKKFPLSMGIKSARYDHLLLTDADCFPTSSNWLSLMCQQFSTEKQIILGYSPYLKNKTWLNKKIRFETVHSAMQYFAYSLAKNPYMGVGRNLAYHRSLFNHNKGFSSHHHIISGDDDLFINQVANAKNTTICIHPNAFTYSLPKQNEEDWHTQKKRHLSTGKYYKTKHQLLLGIYAISHFGSWMMLVACLFFAKIAILALCGLALRWLLQWFFFQRVCTKLREHDLINYIWLFDIWMLWYNIKSIPSIFFKQTLHWK
jgi:cellulose synthase/poly-beta-1,6-N-acetylglucosamine synthase-like glycosyltransferase